jgi:hypothetical protein
MHGRLGTNWRLIASYILYEHHRKEQIGCGSLSRQSCLQYHAVLASARLWHCNRRITADASVDQVTRGSLRCNPGATI